MCLCALLRMLKMDGKIAGLSLIGREMRTWLGSGTTPLVNGTEIPMTKVSQVIYAEQQPCFVLGYVYFSLKIDIEFKFLTYICLNP